VAWFNQAESATNWIGLFGFGTANDDIFAFTPRGDPWGNTGAYYVRNPTAGGWGFTNEWRSLPDLRDWQDHMVALVWRDGDGTENYGTVEVYLDGVFVTSIMNEGEGPATTYTGFPEEKYRLANFSSVDNWLGRSPGDGGRGYASMTGGIREFRIYDSALSAMEIAMLRPLPEVEDPPPEYPPEIPAWILADGDAATGQFSVSWQEVEGAASYALERSGDGGAGWTPVYSGPGTVHLDTAGFGAYLYRVCAINLAGNSDWVTSDYAIAGMAPPRPSGYVFMDLGANVWRLAGLSFEQVDDAKTAIADVLGTVGFVNGTRAMAWDTTEGKYKTADFFMDAWYGEAINLICGQGFWIRAPEAGDLYILGQVPQQEETVLPLTEGLQLFCPPYPVAVDMNDADVFTSVPIDGDRLTAFDGVQYSTADFFLGQWYGDVLLQPGRGYWYRSGDDQGMTVRKPYP
jgi:hypothetical protein